MSKALIILTIITIIWISNWCNCVKLNKLIYKVEMIHSINYVYEEQYIRISYRSISCLWHFLAEQFVKSIPFYAILNDNRKTNCSLNSVTSSFSLHPRQVNPRAHPVRSPRRRKSIGPNHQSIIGSFKEPRNGWKEVELASRRAQIGAPHPIMVACRRWRKD